MANSITIAAVGDFMIERRALPGEIASVRDLLGGAEFSFGNIDTVLSDLGTPSPKLFNLRGPRGFTDDLHTMGFDAAVLANNHAMDFRAPGMLDMCEALQGSGVAPVGAGGTLSEAIAPLIREINGKRVAVLAVSCTLPPESVATATTPGVAPLHVRQEYVIDPSLMSEQPGSQPFVRTWLDEADLARARSDVEAARAQADVVLVAIHWGVPKPWRAPSYPVIQDHQRELGKTLIDAGADAVIGNHAHELLGVEFHLGKPIAYCLGNFWIHSISKWDWLGRDTIVLRLTFSGDSPVAVEAIPAVLDQDGIPQRTGSEDVFNLLTAACLALGTQVEKSGTSYVIRPLGKPDGPASFSSPDRPAP